MSEPNKTDQRSQAAITGRLAEAGFALPGSLVERVARCGKSNCACHGDPPRLHGPYHQWTRKVNGTNATVNLTDEQFSRYGPWLAEGQRLRTQLNELEVLSLTIAGRREVWSGKLR